jgi:hypothetical protein
MNRNDVHNEVIAENNRQVAELQKIIDAGPMSTPKVRRARQMIRELEEDTAWRQDLINKSTQV